MKTIVAGSRKITSLVIVYRGIQSAPWFATEIVSGGAQGVDRAGEKYAEDTGTPLKVFPADWNKHGRGAGFIRNAQMAEYADALIAIWDGESRGTTHMIETAKRQGLVVHVVTVKVVTP